MLNAGIPLLDEDMLVSVIKQILPSGPEHARVLTAEDKAKLDATFLLPHRWEAHYAPKYGSLESFLRSHPKLFGFTTQGAAFRLDRGEGAAHAAAAEAAKGREERDDGAAAAVGQAAEAGGQADARAAPGRAGGSKGQRGRGGRGRGGRGRGGSRGARGRGGSTTQG